MSFNFDDIAKEDESKKISDLDLEILKHYYDSFKIRFTFIFNNVSKLTFDESYKNIHRYFNSLEKYKDIDIDKNYYSNKYGEIYVIFRAAIENSFNKNYYYNLYYDKIDLLNKFPSDSEKFGLYMKYHLSDIKITGHLNYTYSCKHEIQFLFDELKYLKNISFENIDAPYCTFKFCFDKDGLMQNGKIRNIRFKNSSIKKFLAITGNYMFSTDGIMGKEIISFNQKYHEFF